MKIGRRDLSRCYHLLYRLWGGCLASFWENLYIRKILWAWSSPNKKGPVLTQPPSRRLHERRGGIRRRGSNHSHSGSRDSFIVLGGRGKLCDLCLCVFFLGVGWGGGYGRCLGDFFCCMFFALKSVLGKGYVNSNKRTYCKNISAGADEVEL